jgi:hypothetical protein
VPTLAQHQSNKSWNCYHPEEVWNAMRQLALHEINRESAGNRQLKDEESTRRRGFHWELQAYLLGFRPVRSKFVENPLKGNNSRISRFKSYIPSTDNIIYFKNLNTKTSLKLKINLIRAWEIHICPIKSKKG